MPGDLRAASSAAGSCAANACWEPPNSWATAPAVSALVSPGPRAGQPAVVAEHAEQLGVTQREHQRAGAALGQPGDGPLRARRRVPNSAGPRPGRRRSGRSRRCRAGCPHTRCRPQAAVDCPASRSAARRRRARRRTRSAVRLGLPALGPHLGPARGAVQQHDHRERRARLREPGRRARTPAASRAANPDAAPGHRQATTRPRPAPSPSCRASIDTDVGVGAEQLAHRAEHRVVGVHREADVERQQHDRRRPARRTRVARRRAIMNSPTTTSTLTAEEQHAERPVDDGYVGQPADAGECRSDESVDQQRAADQSRVARRLFFALSSAIQQRAAYAVPDRAAPARDGGQA